jgi:hypothetical protein
MLRQRHRCTPTSGATVLVALLCFTWWCVTTGWRPQLQVRREPTRDAKTTQRRQGRWAIISHTTSPSPSPSQSPPPSQSPLPSPPRPPPPPSPPLPTTLEPTIGAQCHAMPHTELPGGVVRWGEREPSASKCCDECLKNSRCTVWVYCDFAACGGKRGECWLKELSDPYTDIDLVRGRSDLWTAGTRDPPPPQAAQAGRAAVTASEAHLALVTEFGRIRLRLREKSPGA